MDVYTILWLGWIAAFLGIEGAALLDDRKGDTLSEHVWEWFAVKVVAGKTAKGRQVRRFALVAFMAWLSAHFITGGWV